MATLAETFKPREQPFVERTLKDAGFGQPGFTASLGQVPEELPLEARAGQWAFDMFLKAMDVIPSAVKNVFAPEDPTVGQRTQAWLEEHPTLARLVAGTARQPFKLEPTGQPHGWHTAPYRMVPSHETKDEALQKNIEGTAQLTQGLYDLAGYYILVGVGLIPGIDPTDWPKVARKLIGSKYLHDIATGKIAKDLPANLPKIGVKAADLYYLQDAPKMSTGQLLQAVAESRRTGAPLRDVFIQWKHAGKLPTSPREAMRGGAPAYDEVVQGMSGMIAKLTADPNIGGATFAGPLHGGYNRVGRQAFAVGIFPELSETIPGNATAEQIAKFIEKNEDLLGNQALSVGTWFDGKDTVLDIVATPSDRAAAEFLGRHFDQKAIFDLQKLEEIPMGGTGGGAGQIKDVKRRATYATEAVPARMEATRAKDIHKLPEFQAALEEGLKQPLWYNADELKSAFANEQEWETYIGILAATSSARSVPANITLANKAYDLVLRGIPMDDPTWRVSFPAEQLRQIRNVVEGKPISSVKRWNFQRALLGDEQAVVVDRWIGRAYGLPEIYKPSEHSMIPKITEARYAVVSDMVRKEAEAVGVSPRRYQEALWVGMKNITGSSKQHPATPVADMVMARLQKDPALLKRFQEGRLPGKLGAELRNAAVMLGLAILAGQADSEGEDDALQEDAA